MFRKDAQYKLIDLQPLNTPVFTGSLDFILDQGLQVSPDTLANTVHRIKLASKDLDGDSGTEFDLEAEIKKYPDSLFVKCFAIKADEPNDNGDFFSKPELKKAVASFIGVPVFTNHQNNDINQAKGKVVHSWWDEEKNGIMIIARVDAAAYPQLARGIKEEYIVGSSMGCFPGHMRVLMFNGEYVPISEMQRGDLVYTHTGEVKPVKNLQRHLDKENDFLCSISVEGIPDSIESTKEHKFKVLKPSSKCACGCGENLKPLSRTSQRKFEPRQKKGHYQKTNIKISDLCGVQQHEYGWEKACNLQVGDYLVFPIDHEEKEHNDATIDKARLIGLFLSEGSFNKQNGIRKQVLFSFSIDEKDTLAAGTIDLLHKVFPNNVISMQNREERGSVVVCASGSNIAEWFYKYCGEYSHGKRLHHECLKWPKEIQKHLIAAWLDGDGHVRTINHANGVKYKNYVGWTVSATLRSQMILLLARQGIHANTTVLIDGKSSTLRKAAGCETFIVENGSSAKTRRPAYAISMGSSVSGMLSRYSHKQFDGGSSAGPHFRSTKDYIVFPITSITKKFTSEPVYNIEVADNHSYIVEGVTVKNCQVEGSICSVCHNFATSPEEYCTHVKNQKTRKVSFRSIECKYHEHGSEEKCPICEAKKGDKKKFAVDNIKVFEYNYGIKFIENSFVVNPACHDCGITEVIDPKKTTKVAVGEVINIDRFMQRYGEASTTVLGLLKQAAMDCIKTGGQKELEDLNSALSLLVTVSQSMLQQKDQVDLEFASDLVQVIADLQTVTDELTQQGYGRLQSPAMGQPPAEGQALQPPAGQETVGNPAAVPASPSVGKVTSGPAGAAGTVTAPMARKRVSLEKLSLITNRCKKAFNISPPQVQNGKSIRIPFKVGKR